MEFLIIGIVVALNFIIIKMKLDHKRYEDALLDLALLTIITMVFGGSYGALVVGTVASFAISIFFLISPPTFFSGSTGFFQEFKKRAARTPSKASATRKDFEW